MRKLKHRKVCLFQALLSCNAAELFAYTLQMETIHKNYLKSRNIFCEPFQVPKAITIWELVNTMVKLAGTFIELKIMMNNEFSLYLSQITLHYILHSRRREIDVMNLERKGYFFKKD